MDAALIEEQFPNRAPPQGVPQSGGVHFWHIHARDRDGSLSPEMRFTVE